MFLKLKATQFIPLNNSNRIEFIDGLRGLAILLVVLFHAYVRWPEIVPFGGMYSFLNVFQIGTNGVNLFFIISGFVIFMTLEKCHSFREFILRRWLRLFPAMFVCSVIVYFSAGIFYERPQGMPVISDLLPGMTFIEPLWWESLLGHKQGFLEGAFWSLYVEVKFYVISGFLYYFVGGKKMIVIIFSLFLLTIIVHILTKRHTDFDLHTLQNFLIAIDANEFGWFTAGVLYYRSFHERNNLLMLSAVVIAILSALVIYRSLWQAELFAFLLIMIFTSVMLVDVIRYHLCHKFFLFLGMISYPLYLLHENMLVSLIVKMGKFTPQMPSIILPIIPILSVITIGYFVATYIEPRMREIIRPIYKLMRGIY